MNERDLILGRIREALRTPAARPGHHGHEHSLAVEAPSDSARDIGQWLPAVGLSEDDRFALFAKQSAELRTDFHLLPDREAVLARLGEIAKAEGWDRIASHRGELNDAAVAALGLPVLKTDEPYAADQLEKCSAGISACDFLVAQTGSILLSTRSGGGRALSVLPPHHVVLARRDQLVADLPAAFARMKAKYASDWPSFLTVITGPSRTGDIERILVLGAHGPKKLTVLVC